MIRSAPCSREVNFAPPRYFRAKKDGRVRIDATRNFDDLHRASIEVFARSGVDALVREIAEKAGVGIGTFYRHFPQRSDLESTVFRHENDACADFTAEELLDAVARLGDGLCYGTARHGTARHDEIRVHAKGAWRQEPQTRVFAGKNAPACVATRNYTATIHS